jgi:hypothetical protein
MEDAHSPMLIIMPDVLVVANWINEIEKFTKGLEIYNCTKSDVSISVFYCPIGEIIHKLIYRKSRQYHFPNCT